MDSKDPGVPAHTDASADKGAPTDRVDTTGAQTSEQAPMGAHPPEAPRLDKVLTDSYRAVQPPAFRDHPESAVEATDIDVDDTIGGE